METEFSSQEKNKIFKGIDLIAEMLQRAKENLKKDFLTIFKHTGFADIELVNETGFNSSPKTKGVLIRAKKPMILK